jgi:hypothetical protein
MSDRPANAFHTTHWTQVVAARGDSPETKQALRALCETYYGPVELFVRRYRGGADDARDLTHEFFAKLLEGDSLGNVDRTRGRFRSYLLGAVKHFLSDQQDWGQVFKFHFWQDEGLSIWHRDSTRKSGSVLFVRPKMKFEDLPPARDPA